MPKKQETLFKTWNKDQDEAGSLSRPCLQRQTCDIGVQDEEDFAFLDDGIIDAQLLQVCDLTEKDGYQTDSGANHQSSGLSQSFHIGPSAADHSILNCSLIEDTISGFDSQAGSLWIYPTNYPVRDYQFNIARKSLFVNTLVSLPTGLGKTFIAAVVMYNYYRWYPHGKVVFLAPTKPLVAQQIEACFHVMGIPQDHTTEMTGTEVVVVITFYMGAMCNICPAQTMQILL